MGLSFHDGETIVESSASPALCFVPGEADSTPEGSIAHQELESERDTIDF